KGVLCGVGTQKNGQEKDEQTVKEQGVKYHSAPDPNLKSQEAFRVMWYPTYAVVDKKGNVRAIGLKPNFVDKVVEKLLSEDAKAEMSAPVMYALAGGADKPEWREGDADARK